MKKTKNKNTNLLIVPTRGRPHNAERFAEHFFDTSVRSDLLFVIDNDQVDMYKKIKNVSYDILPNYPLNHKLVITANKYVDQYETITNLGDDSILRTKNWDEIIYEPIKEKGYGISYANDLDQTPRLATSTMISSNIIKSLGYISPKTLNHFYADNFWYLLGKKLNALFYFHDVVWEHMHQRLEKAPNDSTYDRGSKFLLMDEYIYHEYLAFNFLKDFIKLKNDLGLND